MTDWLPWGLAMMIGMFTTLALQLRALALTPVGQRPDLRLARRSFRITVLVTVVVYLLYVVLGEGWLWYLR